MIKNFQKIKYQQLNSKEIYDIIKEFWEWVNSDCKLNKKDKENKKIVEDIFLQTPIKKTHIKAI